jgi:hydrogenase expression/formation protein HypC
MPVCLAVPSEILEINDRVATVEVSGIRRRVSLLLLPEEAAVGDYVLVHAGFAIHRIDPVAAREGLELLQEFVEREET